MENLAWISLSLGWSADMARICRLCRTVSGIITARTITVNNRMLRPKLLKNMAYNSTRLLTIGSRMTRFQMSPIISK